MIKNAEMVNIHMKIRYFLPLKNEVFFIEILAAVHFLTCLSGWSVFVVAGGNTPQQKIPKCLTPFLGKSTKFT